MIPSLRPPSARRCVRKAPVDGDRGAGRRGLAGREEENGPRDVARGNARLQEVPIPVVFLEPFLVGPAPAHAFGTDLGPETGAALSLRENGVGGDHVDAYSEGRELERGHARKLMGGGLRCAVGAEARAWGENVLGGDEDDVAAAALTLEPFRRFAQEKERSLEVDRLEPPELLEVHPRQRR